jgi:hypothetical protein
MKPLIKSNPRHTLIEGIAMNFAAEYYEIGRMQGLTSIHKTHKAFAKANFEKFIPATIKTLRQQLANPKIPEAQKEIIYEAIMERVNDPDLKAREASLPGGLQLPDVDIALLLNQFGIRQTASNQGLEKAAKVLANPKQAVEVSKLKSLKNGRW